MGAAKQKPPAEALALARRGVVDVVADRIGELCQGGELHLPEKYSAPNALKAAWLALQEVKDKDGNLALQVCSQNSIANALLDMVVQGLNPAKDQCYFIAYGKTLVCQRSYVGAVALLRRVYGQETAVNAEVVYQGDEFEYSLERGRKRVVRHVQKLENVDPQKIVAAYAVVEMPDREPVTEIMTMSQVRRAWEQGQTKGKSPAHTGFPDQMAKKTVINRAVKILVKGSDDEVLVRAIERSELSAAEAELSDEIEQHANRELIDFPETRSLPAEQTSIEEATVEREKATAQGNADPGF